MVETWVELARGPIFRAALVFMVAGLIRHVVITVWELQRITQRAGDKNVSYLQVARATLAWLFPIRKVGQRLGYSLTTVTFHVAIIVVPVFLAGHVALWKSSVGLSWPVISNGLADALAMIAVTTALLLVIQRATARDTRALSRFQDYALPLLIAVPFASGLLVMHPAWNPFAYDATMLVHVMSGNLLFVLIPITKLSHMVLFPATQLVSELAWHFPAGAGSRVAVMLEKQDQPI